MFNDIEVMIREKSLSPFCKLSDRGLQAVFAGSLDIVHLSSDESIELQSTADQYVTVIRGALDILGAEGRYAGETVHSHNTASSPMVFHGDDGTIRLRAYTDTLLLKGDGDAINDIVSLDALASDRQADIDVLHLVLMRNAKSFATLPSPALIDIYQHMKEITVDAGTEVVGQDHKGDLFYFILEGSAEVWQEDLDDDEPRHVASLGSGDGFGEEALILGDARNATVRMVTNGRLLTLDGESYRELISKPSVVRISSAQAQDQLAGGAQLLDVRYEDEWMESHIPGCIHIPLGNVRARMGEMDKSRDVVVYCRSGRRSQVGAILLTQHGFKAVSMDGGILEWPGETQAALKSRVSA